MTRIILFRRSGALEGFEARGHAGYAQEGSDIVCSAVSAITQTAVLGLTEAAGLKPLVEVKEARLSCRLPEGLSPEERERAKLILETMAIGLRSIAADYGEYLSITERKV